MIIYILKSVNKNKGSSALLRAYGWVGQAQHSFSFLPSFIQYAPPTKFFPEGEQSPDGASRAKPKQAGKKKRGSGGNEFLSAVRR